MPSTTALWFDIETTFSELHALCVEARAAELARLGAIEEKKLFQTARMGRVMLENLPEPRSSRYPGAVEMAKDVVFREAHVDGADFVELRQNVRKRLTTLKTRLAQTLTEHEVYYVLFPVVVYADELVNAVSRGAASRWEALQSELYEIDNGGEAFYSILDDRLRQEETHPLVFEVFYYCLSDGFLGAYQGDPRKIEEYKARLVERIRLKPIEPDTGAHKEAPPVELVKFPWRYHAVAAGAIAGTYFLLSWLGWMS